MSNFSTARSWLEAETARRYRIFTEKTGMYQELSRVMVELAGIKPGMRVLDLGCGTGITTQAVLEALAGQGQVYALDLSESMLAVARERVAGQPVTFLQADAAEFAHLLAGPVDRVVCNSLFWQFRDKPRVMAELARVLTAEGRFVFNAPEPYFIFKTIPRSSKISILFEQLAAEKYGVGRQDLRTMEVFLNNHRFELVETKIIERVRSAEESYLFMQLPVATAWMDPPLEYETRLALLEEARQLAQLDQTSRQRWIYLVTRSQSPEISGK